MIRTIGVVRYVTPLREGGSLPALVEGDDGFLYVLKFTGAGQGPKALIAEFLGSLIAKEIGLNIPELVWANLPEGFGRMERDEEIQDLLKASVGLNLGIHFISGATTFDPSVHSIDKHTSGKILWLDAFLKNVDRTIRNTNLLLRYNQLWVIDLGASLYFHHNSDDFSGQAARPFPLIKDHVLLHTADDLDRISEEFARKLTDEFLQKITENIPHEWLSRTSDPNGVRMSYLNYFHERMEYRKQLLEEMKHAGSLRI